MAYDPKTQIEDMMRAATDPIIVMDEGWARTLASWVRQAIHTERMIQVLEASKKDRRPDMATDAEAMAYLSTASFLGPMPHDLVEIYFWLGRKVTKGGPLEKQMAEISEQRGVPDELTSDQVRELEDLKHWIWDQRLKGRKRRRTKSAALGAEGKIGLWRVSVEDPDEEVESSVHVLEADAKAHAKRALEGILDRMDFQLEVFREHLLRLPVTGGEYYYDVMAKVEETRDLLEKDDAWGAVAIWQEFEELDEAVPDGGEVGPPPFWPLVGRIRVETE